MAGSNATPRGVPRRILQGEGPRIDALGASQIPTIQYSTGNAKALAEFSRNLFSLSNQYEDQLDEQAAAESAGQGAIAGTTGDFELQNYGTIRGRAFNKAAIETFAATLDTQSMVQLAGLQAQYWNDPEGLRRAWGDYTNGVADELEKTSPEQAALYRNRQTVRGLPAVEQAKDTQFKLTRSQADAALIEQETALRSMVKDHAGDLFSENPDRSRAAANAIGVAQREYMAIYNAVGPDGRPLYSPAEVAKAKAEFRDLSMKEAALSWFDEQPDKAGAYLKMIGGDFKIKLNASNDHVKIHMINHDRKRNDPLKPGLQEQLRAAAAATGEGISIQVHSGGQETAEEVAAGKGARTGSPRHDHGGAGDLRLVRDGKVLNVNDDRELYRKFAQNLAAAGVTGIGVDEAAGYIHAGGGTKAAWGYRGKTASSAFLPSDFKSAIEAGYAGEAIDPKPQVTEVPMAETLSPEAFNSLDAEMRARIGFSNALADRSRAEQTRLIEAQQEKAEGDYLARIFGNGLEDPATGKPIVAPSMPEVLDAQKRGWISKSGFNAIAKALTTERPEVSDQATYRDILARVYAGEDVYQAVIDAGGKLSSADTAELLGKNKSVVRDQFREFSADQKHSYSMLNTQLGGDNPMAPFDSGQLFRRAQALDEYRRRVLDPNNTLQPYEIANDIAARATSEEAGNAAGKLQRLIIPQFAVKVPDQYRVDVKQSKQQLKAAYASKLITEAELLRQGELLQQWDEYQREADQAAERAKQARQQKGNK